MARTKELAAIMANMGHNTSSERNLAELEGTKEKDPTKETEPVPRATPINEREGEKEIQALKEELVSQAALRERERDLRKTTEEEKQGIEESL